MQNVTNTFHVTFTNYITTLYHIKNYNCQCTNLFFIKKEMPSIELAKMLLDARPLFPQTAVPTLIPPGYATELQPLGAS